MTVLAGRHVLIVEDEPLIAMDLEMVLNEAGCASVSTATTLADAIAQIGTRRFDVAVLDVTLHGSKVYPAADALAEQAVPFLFMTGHSSNVVPERHRGRPVLGKPYGPTTLVATVARIAAGRERAQGGRH
jgi:DNA-binding NtrC family response regulator